MSSSDCSPINIAVHRENFNIEDDGKFEVTEHPNLFTPRALSSQTFSCKYRTSVYEVGFSVSAGETIARVRVDDKNHF